MVSWLERNDSNPLATCKVTIPYQNGIVTFSCLARKLVFSFLQLTTVLAGITGAAAHECIGACAETAEDLVTIAM